MTMDRSQNEFNLQVTHPSLDHPQNTLALLQHWAQAGWLRPLDVAFAQFLHREAKDAPPLLLLAAALASHQLGRGHACLDLAVTLDNPNFALSLPPESDSLLEPALQVPPPHPAQVLSSLTLADWQAALHEPELVDDGTAITPLVLKGQRLYLQRYWQYEQQVWLALDDRLQRWQDQHIHCATVRSILDILFPVKSSRPNGQKIACALAVRSGFSIITGGPGTGKTTTVVRLLALLQALALSTKSPRPLRIRLAAPTGKAAARLNAAIGGAVAGLPLKELGSQAEPIRAAIPLQVVTLHRLLGRHIQSRQPHYHARRQLALDVLVIDEASMVDLEMMANVLAALPASARLILLGDKDQLASVEAGAILGELCERAHNGHYHPATRDWLHEASGEMLDAKWVNATNARPLDQAIAMLRHSYRFPASSGIGRLAAAVNGGSVRSLSTVYQGSWSDVAFVNLYHDRQERDFAALVIDGRCSNNEQQAPPHWPGYRHYLSVVQHQQPAAAAPPSVFDDWAIAALEAQRQFQVLAALRRGAWGVEGLNRRIAQALTEAALIQPVSEWYLGRPVLVTRNDYALGLMNGDMGLTLHYPTPGSGVLATRVAFPDSSQPNGIHWVLPSRLQAVETVYALTVHKAQGSEFSHTALMLPPLLNPILTREWLYTGITRASQSLTLVQSDQQQLIFDIIQRRVIRASGLREQWR